MKEHQLFRLRHEKHWEKNGFIRRQSSVTSVSVLRDGASEFCFLLKRVSFLWRKVYLCVHVCSSNPVFMTQHSTPQRWKMFWCCIRTFFFFCLSCQLRETRMKLCSLYRRVTDVTSWYNNETEQRHRGDTWGKWGSQRRVLLCVASHSLSIIYVGACSDESSFVRVAWSEYFLKISSMFDIDRTGWSQRGREDGLPASSPVTEAMFPRDVKRLSSKLLKVLKNNKNLNLLKLFWVNYLGCVKLKFKLVDVEANRGQR